MRILAALAFTALSAHAQQGWWMQEPIRLVQTNLRETDATLDPPHLVNQLTDMRANVLLFGMGGIVAYYPTTTPFHYPSPYLPKGRDMFGDVLTAAHSRGVRVIGRFDFSKTDKRVFDAHPEWFFRQANGEPVIYNGLYSTCINGGYYRRQALAILTEALTKYDVDGLFFNMFGNQSRDYSGRGVGLCHCAECQRRFREMFHRELPDKPDDDYRRFMFASSREVAAAIGDLIHAKRPAAGYFNYIQQSTDGIMSESNTAVNRPLPQWPYTASDNVNRARNSEPGKMAVDLDMQFVDMWWRFATVSPYEITSRIWQNIANGGALTFEVNGTLDLQDRQALNAAKPVFRWVAEHAEYYSGQQNAARILLLGGSQNAGRVFRTGEYRGIFRLLTENHIPFAVSDNTEILKNRRFDVIIATDWVPPELRRYAENGGHVLIVSSAPPGFPEFEPVRTDSDMKGYVRVRDHAAFPSLKDADLLLLDGRFTEVRSQAPAPLTLVPPSMIGPPEFVHIDQKDTNIPAIVSARLGKGSFTWMPWDLGGLYYRLGLPAHAALFRDVFDRLEPRRQLLTDAHPLVEMTLLHQNARTLLHLVNFSGHADTAWFQPAPMRNIRIRLDGAYKSAESIRSPGRLPLEAHGGYSEFVLPSLSDYEIIVLRN
jgi:hypothetical protein